jgi:mannan endo-1,4-beta-mannosidase
LRLTRIAATGVALVAAAAITAAVGDHDRSAGERAAAAGAPKPIRVASASLPTAPGSYLGVYVPGVPGSYRALTAFTAATGVRPGIAVYYSSWFEPFQAGFAEAAASHRAVPVVQINPLHVSLDAIAYGKYDSYLNAYASAVRSYRRPVILSFGHEMNASWYPWGYRHTSPATFVAAWRHIVTLFHNDGAYNVTWMWTVNVISTGQHVVSPAAWWPGQSYVNWVGIDGYYLTSSATFSGLFGPTVAAVHGLTPDPVLISETGVAPGPGRLTEIPDLFAGVRAARLLGLVWFDARGTRDWRLDSPALLAAFRRGARAYQASQGASTQALRGRTGQ